MSETTKSQLEQFSKAELTDYLLAIGEDYIVQRHPPERTILEFRLDEVHKEIGENLEKTDALLAEAKAGRINNFDFALRHDALNKEWHRLHQKQRKIEKKLYPKT